MAEMKPNNDDSKKPGGLPPLSSNPSGGTKLPSFKSSLSKKKPSSGGGKKSGAAVVPTWGGPGAGADKLAGAPMFRGAGAMAGKKSLMGRLKGLKTKDMAFIAAGLGVLVMAPLAEYLISDSGDGAATMSEGFDRKGGFFAEPQDLYEAGVEGIAPGGLMGRDTDVITPLNVRDPSSLIMGPGGQEEKPAPSAVIDEPKRDAPKDDTDWKKIIDSAKSGVKAATKKVKLPRPNAKLAGALSGLKGLAGGGNTRASLSLAAPRTPGAQAPGSAGTSLSRTQAVPGFRGAGGRSLTGGGGQTSGGFGRASNPGGTTGQSASSYGGINGGGTGTGFGRPGGQGTPTKNPGGNSTKDNKTLGENLAFLRAKMNMEKAIDLKWAKKRYNELERKKMLEQMAAQTAQQAFMKILDRLLKGGEKGKDGGGSGGGGGGDPKGGDQGTKDGEKLGEGTDLPSANDPNSLPNVAAKDAMAGVKKSRKMIRDAKGVLGKLDGSNVAAEAARLKATGHPVSIALGAVIGKGGEQVGKSKEAAEKALESAPEALEPIKTKNTETKEALDKIKEAKLGTVVPANLKTAKGSVAKLTNSGSDPVKLVGSKSGDIPELKPEFPEVTASSSKPNLDTAAVDGFVEGVETLKTEFAAAAKEALGTGGVAQLPMTLTEGNKKIDALIGQPITDHQTTLVAVQKTLEEAHTLSGEAVTAYGTARTEAKKVVDDYGKAKTAWEGLTWKAGDYSDKTDKTYTGKISESATAIAARDKAKAAIGAVDPSTVDGKVTEAETKLGKSQGGR